MNLHEAISTLADPCLDLIRRVKEVEKICSENSLSLKSHSGVIGAQSVTLENHTSQIEGLMALRLRSKFCIRKRIRYLLSQDKTHKPHKN